MRLGSSTYLGGCDAPPKRSANSRRLHHDGCRHYRCICTGGVASNSNSRPANNNNSWVGAGRNRGLGGAGADNSGGAGSNGSNGGKSAIGVKIGSGGVVASVASVTRLTNAVEGILFTLCRSRGRTGSNHHRHGGSRGVDRGTPTNGGAPMLSGSNGRASM